MTDFQNTNTNNKHHIDLVGKELSESGRVMLLVLAAAALLLTAVLTSSCSNTGGFEEDLRLAEMSIANGDMTTARSVAEHLTSDKNISGLSAKQLARLSMVYIQLADKEENSDLAANATECYRKATQVNSDSVDDYFQSLGSESSDYATLLHHLVSAADARYSFDDVPTDTDSLTENQLDTK